MWRASPRIFVSLFLCFSSSYHTTFAVLFFISALSSLSAVLSCRTTSEGASERNERKEEQMKFFDLSSSLESKNKEKSISHQTKQQQPVKNCFAQLFACVLFFLLISIPFAVFLACFGYSFLGHFSPIKICRRSANMPFQFRQPKSVQEVRRERNAEEETFILYT